MRICLAYGSESILWQEEKILMIGKENKAMSSEFLNDNEYYARFLDGDKDAFEYLVLSYKDKLIYFLNRYVHNITIAEDLAQDAFVEVYVHKERFHFKGSFKTYLYTIGRNKAVDYIRKNERMLFVADYPEDAEEESMLENLIKEEQKRHLHGAIKQLKNDYQAAISLIDIEGMSYAEAAKILKKTDGQMKVLIHRARKSLGKILEKEGCLDEK
ncbi:MAG: RNA polymerase sigma factor [Lachnospiraceae bacterium]|nr:RNA polymerase sigma factor [Lachnospiraceae bacterium]